MRAWPALRVSGLTTTFVPDVPTGDVLQAALLDHPLVAIEERTADEWHIVFADADERHAAASAVRLALPSLAIEALEVDDGDWAARSQASVHAIRVGNLTVAPPWDDRTLDAPHRIVIQPSMGFGTAHHPTTRLCLSALQRLPVAGARVMDVGTGSGVLALAASLLGAADVVAIDDDPDALHAAEENLTRNPGTRVAFMVADLRDFTHRPFDIVTANLTGGFLQTAATWLEHLTVEGGTIVMSGILASEAAAVVASFTRCTPTETTQEDEWVAFVLRREAP